MLPVVQPGPLHLPLPQREPEGLDENAGWHRQRGTCAPRFRCSSGSRGVRGRRASPRSVGSDERRSVVPGTAAAAAAIHDTVTCAVSPRAETARISCVPATNVQRCRSQGLPSIDQRARGATPSVSDDGVRRSVVSTPLSPQSPAASRCSRRSQWLASPFGPEQPENDRASIHPANLAHRQWHDRRRPVRPRLREWRQQATARSAARHSPPLARARSRPRGSRRWTAGEHASAPRTSSSCRG